MYKLTVKQTHHMLHKLEKKGHAHDEFELWYAGVWAYMMTADKGYMVKIPTFDEEMENNLEYEENPSQDQLLRVSANKIHNLIEENEQLKKENIELKLDIEELKPFKEKPSTVDPVIPLLQKEIDRLTTENEQLKKKRIK